MCEDARHGYELTLGQEHPSTQRCLALLAFTYSRKGRYADAEPLFINAQSILARTMGPDHPDVLRVQSDHALNLAKMGRTQEARELFRDALRRMETDLDSHTTAARLRTARRLHEVIGRDPTVKEGVESWKIA